MAGPHIRPVSDPIVLKLTAGPALKTSVCVCFSFFRRTTNISTQHSYTILRLESCATLPSLSHVDYFDTASRQRRVLGSRVTGRYGRSNFQSFPFLGKRGTRKRRFQEQLWVWAVGEAGTEGVGGYGSCHACVRAHARTLLQLSPHGASKTSINAQRKI